MLSPCPILDTAKYGMIKDLPAHRLPPGAWTDVNNVRFLDGYMTQAMPFSFYAMRGLSTKAPCLLMPAFGPGQGWIYVDDLYLMYMTRTGAANGTLGGHAYAPNVNWQGSMFNGFAILNNEVDAPRYAYFDGTYAVFGNVPAWPADLRVKVLRPYKNFLVGLDVTVGGARDKRRVRWSASADPATLPTSWDITDATKDAGDVSLAEGTDGLLDCLPLGNGNIVYGETQTWVMRYVGGQFIFAFDRLFPITGILATDTLTAIPQGHFVITQDDLIIHAGDSPKSVGDMAMRRWFFKNLSPEHYRHTQVFSFKAEREVWICYPSIHTVVNAEGFPRVDSALIWNWQTNVFTYRDLSLAGSVDTHRLAVGYSPKVSGSPFTTWDSDTYSWDSDTESWDTLSPSDRSGEGIILDQGTNWVYIDGTAEGVLSSSFERLGIGINANNELEHYNYKELVAIRPDFEAPEGSTILIQAGHQNLKNDPVTWDDSQIFTVGVDTEVQIHTTGRYICLRFFIQPTGKDWKFYGYYLDQAQLKEGL